MRLVIFTENTAKGGLDTFLCSLLDGLNNVFEIEVIVNNDHPGVEKLKALENDKVTITTHNMILPFQHNKIKKNIVGRLSYKLFVIPYLLYSIYKLFSSVKADKCMIVNGGYPGGLSCRLASIAWYLKHRTKSVHNFHNLAVQDHGFFRSILGFLLDSILINVTSSFVTVSSACSNSLNLRPAFRNIKSNHIYNAVSAIDLKYLPTMHPNYSTVNAFKNKFDFNLVIIGTFEKRKGHELLFNALRDLLDLGFEVGLTIFGTGSENDVIRLNECAEKLNIKNNLNFEGFVDNSVYLLTLFDCVVVPSVELESFGYVALEAQIKNIPVVVTPIGGLPEVVSNYPLGVVANDVSSKEIVNSILKVFNKLEQIMDIEPKLRDEFNPNSMSKAYLKIINGE